MLTLKEIDAILQIPVSLPSGPVSNDGAYNVRNVVGMGPHIAGSPPLRDPTIVENGENNERFTS